MSRRRITRHLGRQGFMLLELIIVISIMSLMTLIVAPRISTYFGNERGSFILLTSVIAKSFDDAFIHGHTNFLVIHLYDPDGALYEYGGDVFSRTNGVSVANIDRNGAITESKNRILRPQAFPGSFRIEEVVLPGGESVKRGNVMVPFYPNGTSDNVIMHILVNDTDRWSVRIFKLKKEPRIYPDYKGFEPQEGS
jgi:hypothetical protein